MCSYLKRKAAALILQITKRSVEKAIQPWQLCFAAKLRNSDSGSLAQTAMGSTRHFFFPLLQWRSGIFCCCYSYFESFCVCVCLCPWLVLLSSLPSRNFCSFFFSPLHRCTHFSSFLKNKLKEPNNEIGSCNVVAVRCPSPNKWCPFLVVVGRLFLTVVPWAPRPPPSPQAHEPPSATLLPAAPTGKEQSTSSASSSPWWRVSSSWLWWSSLPGTCAATVLRCDDPRQQQQQQPADPTPGHRSGGRESASVPTSACRSTPRHSWLMRRRSAPCRRLRTSRRRRQGRYRNYTYASHLLLLLLRWLPQTRTVPPTLTAARLRCCRPVPRRRQQWWSTHSAHPPQACRRRRCAWVLWYRKWVKRKYDRARVGGTHGVITEQQCTTASHPRQSRKEESDLQMRNLEWSRRSVLTFIITEGWNQGSCFHTFFWPFCVRLFFSRIPF